MLRNRIVAWDDFVTEASEPLGGRELPSGQTWTLATSDAGGQGWQGDADVFEGRVGTGFGAWIPAALDIGEAEAWVGTADASTAAYGGLILGISDNQADALGLGVAADGRSRLRTIIAGTAANAFSPGNPNGAYANGSIVHLRVRWDTTGRISWWVDGTFAATHQVTDSALLTVLGQRIGIGGRFLQVVRGFAVRNLTDADIIESFWVGGGD